MLQGAHSASIGDYRKIDFTRAVGEHAGAGKPVDLYSGHYHRFAADKADHSRHRGETCRYNETGDIHWQPAWHVQRDDNVTALTGRHDRLY